MSDVNQSIRANTKLTNVGVMRKSLIAATVSLLSLSFAIPQAKAEVTLCLSRDSEQMSEVLCLKHMPDKAIDIDQQTIATLNQMLDEGYELIVFPNEDNSELLENECVPVEDCRVCDDCAARD